MKIAGLARKSLWGIVILIAVVPIGYAIWLISQSASARRIEITPELSLNMVALLTESAAAYPPQSDWKQTLLDKLPDKLADKIPRKWFQTETHVSWRLSKDQVMVLAKFDFPEKWKVGKSPLSSTRRIEQSLKQAGIDEVYLKFPNGYESLRRSIYVTHIPKWGEDGTTILEGLVFQLPPNVDNFEVHLGGDSAGTSNVNELASIKLNNPIKNHTPPIATSPHTLPVTLTKSEVSVTLNSLLTNVRAPAQGNGQYTASSAASTADAPSQSKAVFKVTDTSSTPSQWSITDPVEVSFGDPGTAFETVSHTTGLPPQQTTLFDTDFGVLEQPVRLTIPLIRISNFPADEQIVGRFPLPEAGKHTDPGEVMDFWDGAVTVFTGNRVSFTSTRSTRPSNSLSLLVSSEKVQTRNITTRLHRVELTTPNKGSLDLMPFVETQSFLTHWFITDFNLSQIMSTKSLTEEDLDGSTLTVTVIRPRKFPHAFEFIAQPTEATVEMARE